MYIILYENFRVQVAKCNSPEESHQNERNPEVVQVRDCTIEDNLKKLISIIYTNKMHQFFDSPLLKNSSIKQV